MICCLSAQFVLKLAQVVQEGRVGQEDRVRGQVVQVRNPAGTASSAVHQLPLPGRVRPPSLPSSDFINSAQIKLVTAFFEVFNSIGAAINR